jgi:glycosyltransferase involved in cell wall biosynthesis
VRIGVLTTSYPRGAGDPAGHFVAGFSRWLAANVGDVEVLCAERPVEQGRALRASLRFSSRLLGHARERARHWDAVVSHWLVPCGAVGMALGLPHLAIAHGSDARLLARLPGGRAFVRSLARRADLVWVAGSLRLDEVGRVQPMGIDVAELTPRSGEREAMRAELLAMRARSSAPRRMVLFLGRLSVEKGADLAIDALPTGDTLVIAGDGPQRRALERRARGRDVIFLGEVRGDRKRALLAAVDLMVVPSRADGAPTVVLEALAAGLPIVATRAGGIPELAPHARLCAPTVSSLWVGLSTPYPARGDARDHDWSAVGPRLAGVIASNAANLRNSRACKPCTIMTRRI